MIRIEDLKVGDRVQARYNPSSNGTVINILADKKRAVILWDDKQCGDEPIVGTGSPTSIILPPPPEPLKPLLRRIPVTTHDGVLVGECNVHGAPRCLYVTNWPSIPGFAGFEFAESPGVLVVSPVRYIQTSKVLPPMTDSIQMSCLKDGTWKRATLVAVWVYGKNDDDSSTRK